jgi:outer membrane biosynthesis protein TonB
MVSPRPWLVISGALALGVGVGAAGVTIMTGDGREAQVLGPGIVLTAVPSDDPGPTASSLPGPEATGAAVDSPEPTPVPEPAPVVTPVPAPAPPPPPPAPAPVAPAPAPAPAPQPVDDDDDDDDDDEGSAD